MKWIEPNKYINQNDLTFYHNPKEFDFLQPFGSIWLSCDSNPSAFQGKPEVSILLLLKSIEGIGVSTMKAFRSDRASLASPCPFLKLKGIQIHWKNLNKHWIHVFEASKQMFFAPSFYSLDVLCQESPAPNQGGLIMKAVCLVQSKHLWGFTCCKARHASLISFWFFPDSLFCSALGRKCWDP